MAGPARRSATRTQRVFDINSYAAPVRSSTGIIAGHAHVAAERQSADAVIRVAMLQPQRRGP